MPGKITMKTPLVEMDGDEMTRIIWHMIKDLLLSPYIDLKTIYYDLAVDNRDKTDNQAAVDAALSVKKYRVGVKCATITANAERVREYRLKKTGESPNAVIREILDGTVFRTPIMAKNFSPLIPSWQKPITIARHAYGDIYKSSECKITQKGKAELVVSDTAGEISRQTVFEFSKPGILLGMYNTVESITNFAQTCFAYALDKKQEVWFGAKDTISKIYDAAFKEIFQAVYEKDYAEKFAEAGIKYFYTLIDDAAARVMRSEGGMIWACKNYDGDVMSDVVASVFGSLAMMTSVLATPDGCYEYEAAHGTVQRHYYKYLKGEPTSTNPMATLFAWTGALQKRGELDGLPALVAFAQKLEAASLKTIEDGVITGDLAPILKTPGKQAVRTEDFLREIKNRLEAE